jgi:hypothetical protein
MVNQEVELVKTNASKLSYCDAFCLASQPAFLPLLNLFARLEPVQVRAKETCIASGGRFVSDPA